MKNLVQRIDGFFNVLTNMGTIKDKTSYNNVSLMEHSESELVNLFFSSSIANKIVSSLPFEATREWIDFENFEKDKLNFIQDKFDKLDVKKIFYKRGIYARLFGRSAILLIDQRELEEPFDENSVIESMLVFSTEITDGTDIDNNLSSKNYNKPIYYNINTKTGGTIKIHNSRLLFEYSSIIENRDMFALSNSFLSFSILNQLFDIIVQWESTFKNVEGILDDFRVKIYKMDGLTNMMTQNVKEDGDCEDINTILKEKVKNLDITSSNYKHKIIDANDDILQITPNLGNISQLLDKLTDRLVAEADIPHTILLGQSPKSSNGTGNSTTLDWYNKIKQYQEVIIRPDIKKILNSITKSFNINSEDVNFSFKPLWQPTQKEEVESKKIQAEIDNLYISSGVLTTDDVRENRFSGKMYSFDTKIEKSSKPIKINNIS